MDNTLIALLVLNALITIWSTVHTIALRGRVYRYMDWIDNFRDKKKRMEIADYEEN